MITFIIAVSFISTIIINLMLGLREYRLRKYYNSLYVAEKTKSYFAKTRNELMNMVIENKIDNKTIFFKNIYSLNTFFMRNPHAYSNISKELTTALLNIKKTNKVPLSEGEKKILQSTAEALGHIVINYSMLMKFLFFSAKKVKTNMNHANFIIFLAHIGNIDRIINAEREKINAEKKIEQTKNELYRLSGSSFAMSS